jgi:hypothetical protein
MALKCHVIYRCWQCWGMSAAILAHVLANNSPKRLFKGFVSLGKTKSVSIVKDSEGYFDSYF